MCDLLFRKIKDRLPAVSGKRSRVTVFGFSLAERTIHGRRPCIVRPFVRDFQLPDKQEFTFLYIRYFVVLGMNFDGFAMNNKYAPHINLVTASAMQIIETGILWNI